jgi:hypothetical protein
MRSVLPALFVLMFACPSIAQSGSWAALGGLKEGQKIKIVETNSKKHSGQFRYVSDSAITFTEGSSERSIPKQDVRSISFENSRRLRNTLIGVGAGIGAGAVFGAIACRNDNWFGPGPCAAGGGLLGGVFGIPIGAVMPTHNSVYKAAAH